MVADARSSGAEPGDGGCVGSNVRSFSRTSMEAWDWVGKTKVLAPGSKCLRSSDWRHRSTVPFALGLGSPVYCCLAEHSRTKWGTYNLLDLQSSDESSMQWSARRRRGSLDPRRLRCSWDTGPVGVELLERLNFTNPVQPAGADQAHGGRIGADDGTRVALGMLQSRFRRPGVGAKWLNGPWISSLFSVGCPSGNE